MKFGLKLVLKLSIIMKLSSNPIVCQCNPIKMAHLHLSPVFLFTFYGYSLSCFVRVPGTANITPIHLDQVRSI